MITMCIKKRHVHHVKKLKVQSYQVEFPIVFHVFYFLFLILENFFKNDDKLPISSKIKRSLYLK